MTDLPFNKACFDLIQASTFGERPFDEILDAALTMVAYAISHRPPREREAALQRLEEGQALRRAVQRFLDCPQPAQPIIKVH